MIRKIFLLTLCLFTVAVAACGRFDVSIIEPTTTPSRRQDGAKAVASGQPVEQVTPRPRPSETNPPPEEPATQPVVVEVVATATLEHELSSEPLDTVGDEATSQSEESDPQSTFCSVRLDWPLYPVKRGDTLSRIARDAGATVDQLVTANCLINADRLYSGQQLRVPRIPADPPEPTSTPEPEPWEGYSDGTYQASFEYPAHWRDVSQGLMTRLAGDDGWVQLAAVGAPADLDTVAADQAFHKLLPFGSTPAVESLTLSDGRPARLILPSADQPEPALGQAMIIAPYADPIPIAGYNHNYLLLTADVDHIRDIGASLVMPAAAGAIFIEDFGFAGEDLPSGGKRLTFHWSARGANRGTLTSGTAQRFAPWWPVESAGKLVVDVPGTIYPDPVMTLRMVNDVTGQEATATAVLSWACEYDYFFQPGPQACPEAAALVVDGVFQAFERGFMIWLPRPNFEQPSIYVFTNDGRVSLYPDTWSADDPGNALGETPPEGLVEPVGGFAKVWREHPAVREDLGWGVSAESLYTLTYQAETRESLPGVTFMTRPDGSIVRLLDTIWQAYIPGQDSPGSGGGLIP